MSESGIIEIFQNEAREILDNIENDLVVLEETKSSEVVNRLFRYYHTLKGSSGIAGFTSISEFTHSLESCLDLVRSGKISITEDLISILLQSTDWIRGTLFEGGIGEKYDTIKNDIFTRLEVIRSGEALPVSVVADKIRYYRIKAAFAENIFEFGIDPLIVMEDLFESGEVVENFVDRRKLSMLSKLDPEKCYFSWRVVVKTAKSIDKIKEVFLFVLDNNEIIIEDITSEYVENLDEKRGEKKLGDILVNKGIVTERELEDVLNEQQKENKKIGEIIVEKGFATPKDLNTALGIQDDIKKKIESNTVRVDTMKLDNLMNLLGEIVIGQASLNRISEALDEEQGYRLKNALYGLDRITREFQEQIMSIRMIPIGPTFDQFKRFVRDMSKQIGKDIRLDINGKDTELDKTVIERISDPLKHMIRNSIDHGIETSEERMNCGKDSQSVISLNAYHQEGSVFIEIKDDGRGLNYEKIRAKAIAKNIISKDDEVSEEKLKSFIFLPAFSTSDSVSDLSGRGVGMDVVKSNIDALRGTIEIDSIKGKGTTVRIKLPLTLAIIDGMLFRVGNSTYIVPLLSIVESIQPKKDDVKTIKGKGEVVLVRGEYVSLIRLYDFFSTSADHTNPWESLLIIVETNGERLALMIDDLIGQQQIVIKSLDSYITQSSAISGATILGDGSVALIIDIHGLMSGLKNEKVIE
ncbi:MAG TPA: chemotaxis protein CheA [Spirochaetota bacterium]|nr:chemotaxis protein CheA [Spirochaetota bacterium]HOF33150.1 chemotaxis protein CheA [Spirochaetota bacterium]HOH37194.1 chemotaxis protein CheA [Spirochaetota bacterium]HOR43406.1 chemotaxis protein CheA [Spirochaetota bacterium]HPJ13648.1 chemotaxis protein CheA [Spirochaetota bacterium]